MGILKGPGENQTRRELGLEDRGSGREEFQRSRAECKARNEAASVAGVADFEVRCRKPGSRRRCSLKKEAHGHCVTICDTRLLPFSSLPLLPPSRPKDLFRRRTKFYTILYIRIYLLCIPMNSKRRLRSHLPSKSGRWSGETRRKGKRKRAEARCYVRRSRRERGYWVRAKMVRN
jgi:hypothetical protein